MYFAGLWPVRRWNVPEKYEANSAFLLATAFCLCKKQSVEATNGIILSESLDILKSLKATYP